MTNQDALEKRVTQLEELLSHQEHLLQQLDKVALDLRKDHEAFKTKALERISRLEATIEQQATPLDPNEKPPHY